MAQFIIGLILVIAVIALIIRFRVFLLTMAVLGLAAAAVIKYFKSTWASSDEEKSVMTGNLIEFLLCLFLGWMGAHKFYRGKKKTGLIYLFSLGLLCVGWWGDLAQICMIYFGKEDSTDTSTKSKIASYGIALICALILGSCTASSQAKDIEPNETVPTAVTTETIAETTEATTEATADPTTEATTEATTEPPAEPTTEATEEEPIGNTYILNTNTKKFHYPSCSSAKETKENNKKTFIGTRDEVIAKGYKACGRCHP